MHQSLVGHETPVSPERPHPPRLTASQELPVHRTTSGRLSMPLYWWPTAMHMLAEAQDTEARRVCEIRGSLSHRLPSSTSMTPALPSVLSGGASVAFRDEGSSEPTTTQKRSDKHEMPSGRYQFGPGSRAIPRRQESSC